MKIVVLSSFFLFLVFGLGLNDLQADAQGCPWDAFSFQAEAAKNPVLTDFMTGKFYLLPENIASKHISEDAIKPTKNIGELFKNNSKLFDYINLGLSSNLQKKLYDYMLEKAKSWSESKNELIFNINYNYELSSDWRMRGNRSMRPNDKYQLMFIEVKEKIFRQEISKILTIPVYAQNLQPVNFCQNLLPIFEYLENLLFLLSPNDFTQFAQLSNFVGNLYYCFGEFLTIAGLKHSAFRAYLRSQEFSNLEEMKDLAAKAAFEIKDSVQCDKTNFSNEFLRTQHQSASKFRADFIEFASDKFLENTKISFQELKTAFMAEEFDSRTKFSIFVIIAISSIVLIFTILVYLRLKKKQNTD